MLRENSIDETAIVDSDGMVYSFRTLDMNIRRLSNMLTAVAPSQIGIHNESEFQTICAIKACINTGTNFIVIPKEEPEESYIVRCSMASIDLLISDFHIDENYITLHPLRGIVTRGGIAADIIGSEEILNDLILKVDLVMSCTELSNVYVDAATRKQAVHICFHKGVCLEGYKFSGFTLDKLLIGIDNAQRIHNYMDCEGTVLFMERLDLTYDIINGVLAPLEKGIKVVFANTSSHNTLLNSLSVYAGTIYISATTLENLLTLLEGEMPKIFKKAGSAVRNLFLKRLFSNYFNSSIKHLLVTGKINKYKLINLLGVPITTLYTMCEVTSFVSFKRHEKLTPDSSVGKVNKEHVQIINSDHTYDHGGILVYTDDMTITTNASFTEESFFHRFPGRLWTKDVGYIDADHELHVLNKTNLVFEEYNGKLVPTGKIIELALSKPFVKKALLISTTKSRLTLLVEPNVDWAESKKANLEDLQFLCRNLSSDIYRNFNGSYPIDAVLYTDKDGLDTQLYKILIRR